MTSHSSPGRTITGSGVNPLVGGVFGAVFVLVGLLGFVVSGG